MVVYSAPGHVKKRIFYHFKDIRITGLPVIAQQKQPVGVPGPSVGSKMSGTGLIICPAQCGGVFKFLDHICTIWFRTRPGRSKKIG